MPRICYVPKKFGSEALSLIDHANAISREYAAAGYDLTLRQLYYQFVARAIIPNNMKSYKRLGGVVNDGRLAGLIDWNYINDRTRNLATLPHWTSPSNILEAVAQQYRIDKWKDQPVHVEVWVEKEALAGIVGQVCTDLDVPYFACRGYVSQSEQWHAARRFSAYIGAGQEVLVLHLGDHDPSGIDMTRDNRDRLSMFIEHDKGMHAAARLTVKRIALNMDQVEAYDPPPNPAKLTDSRVGPYIEEFGEESWELDALPPDVLAALIRSEIEAVRNEFQWEMDRAEEELDKSRLQYVADNWEELSDRFDAEVNDANEDDEG
jgi:hypothetical protein